MFDFSRFVILSGAFWKALCREAHSGHSSRSHADTTYSPCCLAMLLGGVTVSCFLSCWKGSRDLAMLTGLTTAVAKRSHQRDAAPLPGGLGTGLSCSWSSKSVTGSTEKQKQISFCFRKEDRLLILRDSIIHERQGLKDSQVCPHKTYQLNLCIWINICLLRYLFHLREN